MSSEEPKSQKGPRACATCARAKSRCVPGLEGMKCERCHRLNKSCPSQTPAPPRKRKEPKPGRIGELERRIMDLTARVESVQRQGPPPPTPPKSESQQQSFLGGGGGGSSSSSRRASEPRIQSQSQFLSSGGGGAAGHAPRIDRWHNPFGHLFPSHEDPAAAAEHKDPHIKRLTASPPSKGSQPLIIHQGVVEWPEGVEAEELLAIYKQHMLHLYPFVVVPPHMSAYELRQSRPFLWKAVMMEACHNDGPRQISLGNGLLHDISRVSIFEPEKDDDVVRLQAKRLDLLQGLQLLLTWYHYNLNSFQMTNLLYLARAMCANLGFSELQGTKEPKSFSSECLERMRAFAGTYYLVTIVFTTNKKPDGLMGTTYLEECCLTLEASMEYPTDEFLVWLVRAQQLSQSICLALAFRHAGVLGQEPIMSVIERFKQQIQAYRATVPLAIKENATLIGHILVSEILLYEIALQGAPFPTASAPFSASYRLSLLRSCLEATKAFLENRFALQMGEYPRFICMSTFDFVYAFLTALRLITLRMPGWDLAQVQADLEFDKFIERQIHDMDVMVERRRKRRKWLFGNWAGPMVEHEGIVEGIVTLPEEDDEEDPFLRLARKIQVLSRKMRLEINNEFTATQLNIAAETAPMTMSDADGVMGQLVNIWTEPTASDWDAMGGMFFTGSFS
ncbi:protein priB [Echria macrotheca]|uniref:Protein priB n=1 Tax=Echria macrotheca TaxID=438768 RepID=A0AAJ0B4Q6_9PEZI|nr:protein priB [Echria macrotheca]